MTPEQYSRMVPTITYLEPETYDSLVEWLDAPDEDYPKLRALFAKPSPFVRDCE